MKTLVLEEYGLPKALIDRWNEMQGEELLPLQERAIKEHGLLGDESLIISAPTSSGKTFCGELAAARALSERKKTVFLVPLKALAEERYREFADKYDSLGIRTVVSTRDHRNYDGSIEKGEFDLGVIIYEKFNQMLTRNLDLLDSVDLIVIDELQMLADRSRGAVLEMIILKVLRSSYRCRIVGLSAVMSNADELAEWMDARLFVESHRPVELRQGVLLDDTFSYRCFNSGERGTEEMAPSCEMQAVESLLQNVSKLATEGEQVLVFLKSKNTCVQLASLLAERLALTSCDGAIEALGLKETTSLSEELVGVLSNGIAFHHADLSYDERRIVEEHYLSGDIRVIIATTTLSLGLNLPAQTVFLETQKFRQGLYTGRPVMEPLTWSEYENMCGRAGRLRYTSGFGRAIVVAGSELESEMLWKRYTNGSPEKLVGCLFSKSIEDLALDLVASGSATTQESLTGVLESGFSDTPDDLSARIESAIEWLADNDLIFVSENKLCLTYFGLKLARLGMSAVTAARMREVFLDDAGHSALVWMYVLADTCEGRRIYVSARMREEAEYHLFARFKSLLAGEENLPAQLSDLIENPGHLDRQCLTRVRIVLALQDYIDGRSMEEIEANYRIHCGTLESVGETIGWLAECAFCLMGALGISKRRRVLLKRLSFEVRYGLPVSTRKLFTCLRGVLSRHEVLQLWEWGVCTREAFLNADREELDKVIGERRVKIAMRHIANRTQEKLNVTGGNERSEPASRLQLTGAMVRDRYKVFFSGTPLLLTAKSFKYLFKLAVRKKMDSEGWIDKEELEPGFNQARYLYNLKKEMGGSSRDRAELIENDRKGGYRLRLNSDEIDFDLRSLLHSDDFEIADLSRELAVAQ